MIRLAAVLALMAGPVAAQQIPRCAAHADMTRILFMGYGEVSIFRATDEFRRMVEVFANVDTGTWSQTLTAPGEPTCITTTGRNFELAPPPGEPL